MSLFTDAWLSLYDAQTAAVGEERVCTVAGVTARTITTTLNQDEIIVAGGNAEAGGFIAQMLVSDFNGTLPAKEDPATALGVTLSVINAAINNGIIYLTLGDFAAPDNE